MKLIEARAIPSRSQNEHDFGAAKRLPLMKS